MFKALLLYLFAYSTLLDPPEVVETVNLHVTNVLLCHLSYRGIIELRVGFEPTWCNFAGCRLAVCLPKHLVKVLRFELRLFSVPNRVPYPLGDTLWWTLAESNCRPLIAKQMCCHYHQKPSV